MAAQPTTNGCRTGCSRVRRGSVRRDFGTRAALLIHGAREPIAPGADGVLDDSIAPCRFWGWRRAHCLGASGAIRPKRPLGKSVLCRTPCKSSQSPTSSVTTTALTMFTSMWFVCNISLCFSAECAIHNYQPVTERSSATPTKPS